MDSATRTILKSGENLTAALKVFKKSQYSTDATLVLTGTRRPEKGIEEVFSVAIGRDEQGRLLLPSVLAKKLSKNTTQHDGYAHYPFTGLYRVAEDAKVSFVKKGDAYTRKLPDGSTEQVVDLNYRFEDSISLVEAMPVLAAADLVPVAGL